MLTMAEAMLQINFSSGGGKNCPDQTEELSVTQSQYESAAEREYAEQEKLKYWYKNNVGMIFLIHYPHSDCEPKQLYMAQISKSQ